MITYELAKKLKDAGFPQEGFGSGICPKPEDESLSYEERNNLCAYTPTLSELIEACGDCFINIQKDKDGFYCQGVYEDDDERYDSIPYVSTGASTPEEAVANLWLRLNEK